MNKEEIPKKHKEKPLKEKISWDWVPYFMVSLVFIVLFGFMFYGMYHDEVTKQAAKEFCEGKGFVYDEIDDGKIICKQIYKDFTISNLGYNMQ